MGHPINVPIRRTMHLSSVIPANDTGESALGLRNFPHRERGSNLVPEASVLITELPRSYPSSLLAAIKTDHYICLASAGIKQFILCYEDQRRALR